MNEQQWLSCTSPDKMLRYCAGKVSDRKLRLFACSCCRRVWDLLLTDPCRHAVLVAERFSEGLASNEELTRVRRKAKRPARDAATRHIRNFPGAAAKAAAALRGSHAYTRLYEAYGESRRRGAPQRAARALGLSAEAAHDPRDAYLEAEAREAAAQTVLLRDLFGNPWQAMPPLEGTKLAWNDGCIVKLAQAAFEERSLPDGTLSNARLAVLADALEESGFSDAQLLGHLRGPGVHVRGCHTVDFILGQT